MARFSGVLALAAAVFLQGAQASEYKVRVRNLAWRQPFSPLIVVAHTRDVALFKEGTEASEAIQMMAENADNSGLLALLEDEEVSQYICGFVESDDIVDFGDTWRGFFEVDDEICADDAVFSLVGMLTNTNDGFVAIDSESLISSGVSKSYPPAWDAGTEDNNELCEYIPGPACADVPGNLAFGDGEGAIHIHRGIQLIGNLTSITDWRNPIAEVVIFAPDSA